METSLLVLTSPAFNTAFNELISKEMPAASSFILSRILKEIRGHREDFEKARMELIQKHAKKDKKGAPQIDQETQQYKIKDKALFDKEYVGLLEVKVPHGQLPFNSLENISIKAEVLELLVGVVITEP